MTSANDLALCHSTTAAANRPRARGGPLSARELRAYIGADLHRYAGRRTLGAFMRHYWFTPPFRYTVWMRIAGYLRRRRWSRYTLYVPAKLMQLRYRHKFGISIPEHAAIGPGLFISHGGGIVVNGDAVLGANINLSHNVTIGQANRGAKRGSPVIGDHVFIAPGAAVIGHVHIGDQCAIGANAVVTKDAPPSSVLAGVPAKIVSESGSDGYVNRTFTPPPA
ncbi:MAG TPA: hypothetical protein VG841_15285 [Caulobacterales bacterium]|nr:hypothetical protein [Caulobacterales bacterium]